MRLGKEQKRLASIMIWAIDNNFFNYGDSVEYLPKSNRFKVVCSDLDKPLYVRFGGFYHDWLSVDEKTQQEIVEAYEQEKSHYKIRDMKHNYIFEVEYKTFALAFMCVCLVAKPLNRKDFEIDYYQHIVDDQYTRYEGCLKERGIEL